MKKIFSKNLIVFILLLSGLLLARYVLADALGTEFVNNQLGNTLTASNPKTLAIKIINIALGFLGIIAVGIVIWGGIVWMTSNGEEERIDKAKKILKNGLIGLIIILASWAIVMFLFNKLGGAINPPGAGCTNGESQSCGCGGSMICNDGSWSGCVGSDCGCTGNNCGPSSCDSSIEAGCQAAPQKCASTNYCDADDCSCKPKGGLGDPCDSDLSNSTCEPDNNRCGEYLTCDSNTCTCFGPPVITGISPVGGFCQNEPNKPCSTDADCSGSTEKDGGLCNLSAPNGDVLNFITITGKNFGEFAGNSKVLFNGAGTENPKIARWPSVVNPACVDFWTDNQIIVAVPGGAEAGSIAVFNKDGLSDTTDNDYGPAIPNFVPNKIARPGLCSISPNHGVLDNKVTYQGNKLANSEAYFGDYQHNVKGLYPNFNPNGLKGTSTIPNIQSGNTSSFVKTAINGFLQNSNYLFFTKDSEPGEGPYIMSFSPTSSPVGQYVTIRGGGFGGARGTNKVYFDDKEADYNFPEACLNSVWKDNQIIVKVPTSSPAGFHLIKIKINDALIDTSQLNPNNYKVDPLQPLDPSLCKIDPERGPVATPVSLWGEYFGSVNTLGTVKFNHGLNTGTIVKDGRADKITSAVPVGAISGPVSVLKNSRAGNDLNFIVGECSNNAECGGNKVCCPANTYNKGRCVASSQDCFIDIPTSVFEWSFNTGFGSTTNPYLYSCAGAANYSGTCQDSCPNVPGSCSPYDGGIMSVGNCDLACSVAGCRDAAPNNCTYNSTLDKCLKNGNKSTCSLPKLFTYTVNGHTATTTEICNPDAHWEISVSTTCPNGWTRRPGNKCVNLTSACDLCSAELNCEDVGGSGRCVSAKVCPSGAVCQADQNGGTDKCFKTKPATCDCCCQIGQSARDCCSPLQCEGTCGADTGKTENITFGRCGGCKSAGNTPEERDAACNCSGHSGQYCDVDNLEFPDGVCSDCSSLAGQNCKDHGGACCLDSKNDNICRGPASGFASTSPEYGYCAYYNCSETNPTECASGTPLLIADYSSKEACQADCPNSNRCANLNTLGECAAESGCCFDAKATSTAHLLGTCRLGTEIASGSDAGYCGYYSCSEINPRECASSTPIKIGTYNNIDACDRYCPFPPAGPGLYCGGTATSTCGTDICNFPGFNCLLDSGLNGTTPPNCGTCCCNPNAANDSCAAFNLKCLANKGECSGGSRGLCCGCSSDAECGSVSTIGCGSDTCCQARPEVASSSPAHLAKNVCRNAALKVTFNKEMDVTSFANNVLLLEEHDYGNGVCPSGTFVASADSISDLLKIKNQSLLVRAYNKLRFSLTGLVRQLSGRVLAGPPDPNKLYCAVPGSVSSEQSGVNTSLIFTPQKLLSGSTNYYFVVKGDESLNSQSGVLSLEEIGLNGLGYFNPAVLPQGVYINGGSLNFNNHAYKNSHIIEFTTLSEQGPRAGICAIDSLSVIPASYLFSTLNNDLNEDDANPTAKSFDTVKDKDKVFSVSASSQDGQLLHPVTGYFWDWNWLINNSNIAGISTVSGLGNNRVFVSAQPGVTDGETKIKATVNMDRFFQNCNNNANCSCTTDTCPESCCNVYSGGDRLNKTSDIYVFICNNPWPPIKANGEWSPWSDNCDNVTGTCADYNYKFYYCRDTGNDTTLDDLPAVISNAVTLGQGSNLICSADRSEDYCKSLNPGSLCGPDKNGDGSPDGLCIWSILKESYFFREAIPQSSELIDAVDAQTGNAVNVSWSSPASQVSAYKIYYLKSGQSNMLTKTVKPTADNCILSGTNYLCHNIISGLENGKSYIFKVSVISISQTESQLSNEKTAIPTDKTAPAIVTGLRAVQETAEKIRFSWNKNGDDTLFYRLYHGVKPGLYGESFDSEDGATSLILDISRLGSDNNYFAISAIDNYNNESRKSGEILVNINTSGGSTVEQ